MVKRKLQMIPIAFVSYILVIMGINFGVHNVTNKYVGLAVGFVLFLLMIVVHQIGKTAKSMYYVSILVNSLAVGLSISSFYTYRDIVPAMDVMILFSLILVGIITLYAILISLPFIEKYATLYVVIIILSLFLYSLVKWTNNGPQVFSILFFLSFISYFYMIALIWVADPEIAPLWCYSIASFGYFILVSIVVLIIISQGQALEGMDFTGVGSGNRKKKG